MGRPPISLTPDQCREVETLAALLSQDQIADYLGISRTTFQAICARDRQVSERYKRGKAKAIAHVAKGLLQKARDGCTTSSIFYLKTQAGWRETERLEHSGPDGDPIETTSARDQVSALIDRLHQRMRDANALMDAGDPDRPRLEVDQTGPESLPSVVRRDPGS